VRLPGSVPLDELLPLYRNYDIFVLPTHPGEGIPRVLMEAMAAGLPVVTTDVAGIASLITPDANGVLMRTTTASDVAAAVARVITDAPLRRRLIAGGYDTVQAHTLERQAAGMMQVVAAELKLPLVPVPTVA
jgi:glycosyltransferase involved in cell wall biosynthesis